MAQGWRIRRIASPDRFDSRDSYPRESGRHDGPRAAHLYPGGLSGRIGWRVYESQQRARAPSDSPGHCLLPSRQRASDSKRGSQGGTLLINFSGLSSSDVAYAAARTTTLSGPGRAGLGYPGVDVLSAPTSSSFLYGLRSTPNARTNLALANAGTASVTLGERAGAAHGLSLTSGKTFRKNASSPASARRRRRRSLSSGGSARARIPRMSRRCFSDPPSR